MYKLLNLHENTNFFLVFGYTYCDEITEICEDYKIVQLTPHFFFSSNVLCITLAFRLLSRPFMHDFLEEMNIKDRSFFFSSSDLFVCYWIV